jgi:hypothetical protein
MSGATGDAVDTDVSRDRLVAFPFEKSAPLDHRPR